MKRPLTILGIAAATALLLAACGSTIPTAGGTSIVTISIGDAPDLSTVRLKAEHATLWTRIRHRFADLRLLGEAQAYIPSVVDSIRVTVSAPDMATVVGTDSIARGQTTATVRIEVPNGAQRTFVVEGVRGIDSRTYYRGTATTDLTGAEVDLPVTMGFVGPGIVVNNNLSSLPTPTNTPTCGSPGNPPCATITYALTSRTSGTDAILVMAGTYVPGAGATIELFPLQLRPNTALICRGTNYSTVIAPNTTAAINGHDGASVDNCRVTVAFNNTGISDRIGGATPLAQPMRINGNRIDIATFSATSMIGIDLYSDSPVTETTVAGPGVSAIGSITGIRVSSGRSEIRSSSVTGFPTAGITVSAGAADAVVTNSTVTGNTTGILIGTAARPSITGSTISGNGTGISISAGTAEVTSSSVNNNTGAGISITGGSPRISTNSIARNATGISITISTGSAPAIQDNSIYCNSFFDAEVSSVDPVDMRNNAWDRDAATNPPGPIVSSGNCFSGDDICIRGTAPLYTPFRAAVPGGCVPLGKPQPGTGTLLP